MRTKCTKILTLLMVMLSTWVVAQIQVSGVVKDAEGEPLPGAYVENESGESVETDVDGKYTITANQGEELTFSFIGMSDQMQTVSGNSLNVTLGGNQIKEVVVTSILGFKKEAKSEGAASTTVRAEDIVKSAQPTITEAIKGKIPGAVISSASASPGGSTGVILRGFSSLEGSNQPLFVIDGVPIYNNSTFDDELEGGFDFGRGTNDIDPEMVEEMTVLKGASATALYGSRAANGVVIITTKKGKKGKVQVDLISTSEFSKVGRLPAYQKTYGQGWDGQPSY